MDKPSCDLYLTRFHGSHGTMGKEYNKNRHKILNEFDFHSDRTICFGVTHPSASKMLPID